MHVLHVAPSFYPAIKWGGPIFSTKAICDGVATHSDIEISVLTTDAAGPQTKDRLQPSQTQQSRCEKYSVSYARRIAGNSISLELLFRLPGRIKRADLVHLTGTYNFPTLFTLLISRMLQKPVVWSPRGGLQATATWSGSRKIFAKATFERLAQALRPQNTVLLVTSEAEGRDSVTRLNGISVVVVPNSVELPEAPKVHEPKTAERQVSLVFLSRIHPKKGIELLIEAMQKLPPRFKLRVFGDGDANYLDRLQEKAAVLGERLRFEGLVSGDKKAQAYRDSDIFVLPSYSENFGIVVAEALAAGIPVITTTNTPWHDLDKVGCGRCIDLEEDDLAETIVDLSEQDLGMMGHLGREWMRRSFSNEVLSKEIARLYGSLVKGTEAQGSLYE